jgi:hypothetical protein
MKASPDLQRLAEDVTLRFRNFAPTHLAWAAFAAWCGADDSNYRTLVQAYKRVANASAVVPDRPGDAREDDSQK